MSKVLSHGTYTAREIHTCNACEWIENEVIDTLGDYEFTLSELKAIVRARRNGWRIMPGQQYIRIVELIDGEIVTWRALPEIDAICRKHDIYEYEYDSDFI